jgi:hypothetical protein
LLSSVQKQRKQWMRRRLLRHVGVPVRRVAWRTLRKMLGVPIQLRGTTSVDFPYVRRLNVRAAQVCIDGIYIYFPHIISLTLHASRLVCIQGSLNIASRDLPCLPSALFEIHLSVTPGALASVPDEPPLPERPRKTSNSDLTTWYDQQDLTFLRARNNKIVEIQTEISLFGSLKTIDVRVFKLVHSGLL